MKEVENCDISRLERSSFSMAGNEIYFNQNSRVESKKSFDKKLKTEESEIILKEKVRALMEQPYRELSHFVNIAQIKKSELFAKKVFPDAVYQGEMQDGKRNGKGVMRYLNGRVFEGSWANDLRDGKGFERYPNGNSYEGDFRRGVPHGKGIFTWRNGEIYDGEWSEGLKQGDGVWKGLHGDSYIGEWHSSKAEGYGVHIWKNGDRYEGEWKECLKHGNGTDIYANGDMYIGQYRYGKPCGYGQYVWKNGSTYAGEFHDGSKNGFGKWRKSKDQKCNMYEGQYYCDKKQGFGIFIWESGNIYRGQYKNDEREGIGEMRWTDGSLYIGQWAHGIQHGYGRMYFSDSTYKEGLFENNVFKGPLPSVNIPEELRNPDFDIMSLSPSDHIFSDEIRSINYFNYPPRKIQTSVNENPFQVAADVVNTSYSMPKSLKSRHMISSRAPSYKHPKITTHRLLPSPTPRPQLQNRSYSVSVNKLLSRKKVLPRQKSPLDSVLQSRLIPRPRYKKRVWRPAGKTRPPFHQPSAVY